MTSSTTSLAVEPLPSVNTLPVCYTSLTPLVPQRHSTIRYARPTAYRFASEVNAVPALAEEFPSAQNSCPIVFTRGERPRPVLLLGAEKGRNALMSQDGNWKAGLHVPSFLRRHPFMLVRESATSGRMLLCADLAADGFSEDKGDALFDDGKPTETMNRILKYCENYEQAQLRTDALVSELIARDLFQEATVTMRSEDSSRKIDGFQTISEERFKALDDTTLADFVRRGIVGLVSAHWSSISRFQSITEGTVA